jgi:hypothetical protein
MAIEKQLLIPGKRYRSRNAKGEVSVFEATPEIIDKVAFSGNDLIASGYDIPIPFEHDLNQVLSLGGRKKKPLVDDLNNNSGFVQKFVKNADGSLSAFLDIPNKATAEKLGKEIRGASLAIKREFLDVDMDRNKKWEYAPLHLALTNKQTAVGTRTFQHLPDAVLLSLDDEDTEDTTSEDGDSNDLVKNDSINTGVSNGSDKLMKELRRGLKSKLNIELSETTNAGNLLEHLALIVPNLPKMVAESSLQKEGSEETMIDEEEKQIVEDEAETPPPGAKTKNNSNDTGVWAMSLEDENKKLKDQIDVLLSRQAVTAATTLRKRAEALEKSGIDKDTLTKRVYSVLDRKNEKNEVVLLSQTDETLLDTVLGTLEDAAAKLREAVKKTDEDEEDDVLLSQVINNMATNENDEDTSWKEIKKSLSGSAL